MVISSFRYTGANIDTFVDQNKDLKFDSESDRKPVEPSQVWFDVVSPLVRDGTVGASWFLR